MLGTQNEDLGSALQTLLTGVSFRLRLRLPKIGMIEFFCPQYASLRLYAMHVHDYTLCFQIALNFNKLWFNFSYNLGCEFLTHLSNR